MSHTQLLIANKNVCGTTVLMDSNRVCDTVLLVLTGSPVLDKSSTPNANSVSSTVPRTRLLMMNNRVCGTVLLMGLGKCCL